MRGLGGVANSRTRRTNPIRFAIVLSAIAASALFQHTWSHMRREIRSASSSYCSHRFMTVAASATSICSV